MDESPLPTRSTAVPAPRLGGPRAVWGVVLLMLIYVVAFVDRQVLALLVQPIRADLGISDTQMSLLLGTSFVLFYTLLGLPLSTLADRWSRRGTIGLGLVAWSAMTVVCGLAQSFTQLFLARVGVGIGEAALSPAAYSWIAASFPPERRAGALGAYSMGIYLGSGLAFVAGSAVIELAQDPAGAELPGLGLLRPWQATLAIAGACGVLLAPLVLTLREPERAASTANAHERTWRDLVEWLRAHRGVIGPHHLGFALLALSGYAVNVWVPSVLERSHGWTRSQAGVGYGLVLGIAGALGVWTGGLWADRCRRRDRQRGRERAPGATHVRIGMLAAACGVPCAAAIAFAPSGGALLAALVPLSFCTAAGFGVAAAGVQELAPGDLRARAAAVYLLVINLVGLGLGPTAVSLVSDHVLAKSDDALARALALVATLAGIGAALVLRAGWLVARRTASA